MDSTSHAEKRSFPPVADRRARVLVLGSLPGEVSLQRGQYYANPRNQFWPLMQALTQAVMPAGYEARLAALQAAGIGLWDVVKSARRLGSLDAAIVGHTANDLVGLVGGLPALQAIAFNGGKAAKIGRAQLAAASAAESIRVGGRPIRLLDLPSTSPAHAVAFERKLAAWSALQPFLRTLAG